ncbi:molecular chaperone DnaJ [Zavarzinia sp. CC-PAN008]|uniref:molecular chaperone DnaJ n=1 Tax=Zavarzinia sp. CC-PAN008 TaxID=3243332 RepID=UPI003F74295E
MAKADYYDLLGVERSASQEDLKKAFRKLAMKYHPDRNPGDQDAERQFKEINEAYEILKDDQRRAAYDQYGHAAFDPANGGRPGGFDFSSFGSVFEDLFGDFMGGGGRQRGPARGADLRYNLEISLEEAYHGKKTTIRIPSAIACEACDGSGAAAGSKPVTCTTCNGMGKVRAQQGFFTIERACPTCHGHGRMIKDPCKVCGGRGHVAREKTLSVNIPAGVEDGQRMRLKNEGEVAPRGGQPGDLYIFLSVAPHRLFRRDGPNLHCRLPISMVTAALGGAVDVPSLDGAKSKITIPAGTQSGRQFRLKGKGMPTRGQFGDLFVNVAVETPVNLNKRQVELLQEFAKAGGEETSPESEGFFAKVKELWNDLTD